MVPNDSLAASGFKLCWPFIKLLNVAFKSFVILIFKIYCNITKLGSAPFFAFMFAQKALITCWPSLGLMSVTAV